MFERRSTANGTKRPASLQGMAFPVTNDVAKAPRGHPSPQRGARPIVVRQQSEEQKQDSVGTFATNSLAEGKSGSSRSPSVLIVDDNHINRQVSRLWQSVIHHDLTRSAPCYLRTTAIDTT